MSASIATIRKSNYEDVRVDLSDFRGAFRIDVRTWAEPRSGNGDRVPTPQGVSLRVEHLPKLRAALQAAEREAVRLGLLPTGGGAQ